MASNPPKLKIAVVGTGLIGPRHCQTVLNSPDAELIAIVDLARVGQDLANELGIKYYRTVTSILASPDKPDAAIVCTPNHTHVALTRELAEGGVHVLVEKPISTDVASGKILLDVAQKTNVKILVGHHRRFNPYLVSAKQAIVDGKLGDITAVNGLWILFKPPPYFDPPTEWRQSKGGGVILINLIHDVDLLHHLFGPISRVYGERLPSRRNFEAEEGVAITMRFRSGVVGTFIASDNVPSPYTFETGTGENPLIPKAGTDFFRIFGTEGTLSVGDMILWSHEEGKKTWHEPLVPTQLPVVEAVPFDLQLGHFIRVARGQEEPICTVQAGLAALAVCEAVKRSIEQNQAIELDIKEM